MAIYNVHLYREMRLFFPGIEAGSPEQATRIADGLPNDQATVIEDCDGATIAALVDLAGDDEYQHSELVEFFTMQPVKRDAR